MGIKKTYTITLEQTETGNTLTRTNDGFNAFELLGVLAIAKEDIIKQTKNKAENDINVITKQVVKNEEE